MLGQELASCSLVLLPNNLLFCKIAPTMKDLDRNVNQLPKMLWEVLLNQLQTSDLGRTRRLVFTYTLQSYYLSDSARKGRRKNSCVYFCMIIHLIYMELNPSSLVDFSNIAWHFSNI